MSKPSLVASIPLGALELPASEAEEVLPTELEPLVPDVVWPEGFLFSPRIGKSFLPELDSLAGRWAASHSERPSMSIGVIRGGVAPFHG
jgi:hypothetical protein